MRTSLVVEKILDALQGGAETIEALADIFLTDYHTSRRKMAQLLHKGVPSSNSRWADAYLEYSRFLKTVAYLKQQGIVASAERSGERALSLTPKGKNHFERIRERNFYSKSHAAYESRVDGQFKLVMYDIPGAESHKRFWLRWALKAMGFEMLQKSVWAGNKAIPPKFLEDLRERKLFPHVHILQVTKKGTLERME